MKINIIYQAIISVALLSASGCDKSYFNTVQDTDGPEGHFSDFTSILPSQEDRVITAPGYKTNVLISEADPINSSGDTFGYNNDHVQFFPEDLSLLSKTKEITSGYLFISHEYLPVQPEPRTQKVIEFEKYSVGASILKIRKNHENRWEVDLSSPDNRRYHARSKMKIDGPVAKVLGNHVTGTTDNCSGGQTPWGTALSGEESIDYGSVRKWKNFDDRSSGWIVEFDPYDKRRLPVKHSALGRFKHENAAIAISRNGHAVVYMGEDKIGGGFYKFISDKKYNPESRSHNLSLLSSGRLYGAKIDLNKGEGSWVPLDLKHPVSGPVLYQAGFTSNADVLLDVARASKFLGITELDRPEDCEIHPLDSSIYLALTNNMNRIPPNLHGQIVRFVEKKNDLESMTFRFEIVSEGGKESGYSSPDNLAFDSYGNLWITTDIFSPNLTKIAWSFNGNNSLLMMKTGKNHKRPYRFASAPSGAEFTGPWFTGDESVLFLAVQHPGEGMPSSWPEGKARSSVIAIYRD